MKNEELYNKSVDILVNAYMNDTLQHHNCYACAVGNIISASLGINIIKNKHTHCLQDLFWEGYNPYGTKGSKFPQWYSAIINRSSSINKEEVEREVNSTGYSFEELVRIERAFERASQEEDFMFNSLMAVIDVLDIIHENTDVEVTKVSKSKFVKA